VSIRGDSRAVVVHDGIREQGYDNGQATPDGVIVVAALAIVLVSMTWAGAVHVRDVLGDWLGPIVRRRQIIVDSGWCLG
jgi:hypothetical protein